MIMRKCVAHAQYSRVGAHVSIRFHGNVSVLCRCVETGIGTTERNAGRQITNGVIPAKNTRGRRDQKRSQDSDEVNSQYLSLAS